MFSTARPRSAGFSLIEVLLSAVILGITMVGLTEGMSQALRSSREMEDHTRAVLLAQAHLEALRAERRLSASERDGEVTDDPRYRFRERIESTELDGLYHVSLAIELKANRRLLYQLDTLLFEQPFESTASSSSSERRSP
ncbi:MAG: prepilin-type N-terminal cleavage/methylation domain-containing protein [Planctomycetota bacterium]